MAFSDCAKCWSTPCECGNEYSHFSIERLESLRKVLKAIIKQKRALRKGCI